MTIVWHVDDLKVSHKDLKEVDKFIKFLKREYEDDMGKVKVTRGKIHKYLGMTLDYTVAGSVRIDMRDYVEKTLEAFPEEVTGTSIIVEYNRFHSSVILMTTCPIFKF